MQMECHLISRNIEAAALSLGDKMNELDMIQKTATAQGGPIGLTRYDVYAIRKAGRFEGKLIPKLVSPRFLLNWLEAHPEFVPSKVLKTKVEV